MIESGEDSLGMGRQRMDQPPVDSTTYASPSQGQDKPQLPSPPLAPGPPTPRPGVPLPPKPNFTKKSGKTKWIAIGIVTFLAIMWIIGVAIGPRKKAASNPQAKKTVPAQKTSATNPTTAKQQTEKASTPAAAPAATAPSAPASQPQAKQVIDPNQYSAGSADRVFAEYLDAWGMQDWNKMYGLTQLTWRSEKDLEELQADYDFKGLETAKITSRSVVSETTVDFTADVSYKFGSEIKTEVMKARVICESAPYKPDPNGTWGVNPISTL